MKLKNKKFLTITELISFIVIFSFFLILAFPKYLLPKLLQRDYSETSIKYLENLLHFYHNSDITYLLIEKYIYLGKYNKARQLLSSQKNNYKKYYYEYLLTKQIYFDQRWKKSSIKKSLILLKAYAKNNAQKEFIYKEAKNFGFFKLAFQMLQYLHKPKDYINLAIYLKKYNLAMNELLTQLNEKFNEDYFNKLIDIALYKNNLKLATTIALKYYKFIKTKKGYTNLLRIGILQKNKLLIKYSIAKADNINFKMQGYIILKEWDKALKIAKEQKNNFFIAQIYLDKKDYKNAFKYFMKDGLKKNIKIITSLAYILNNYDLLEKIFISKVEHGDYSKVKNLIYFFLKNVEIEKGEKVFKKLYKQTKKDIFLEALFKIYYAIGDTDSIEEIVWKFKKVPLYIAFYVTDLYLSQRDFKSAFKIMKKASPKNYDYYKRLLFIANNLDDDKEKIEIITKMQKIKKTPESVLAMFFIYLKKDKLKAFEYLKSNYITSNALMYQLLKTAYELKQYKFIVSFKPTHKSDFYYKFYLDSLKALHYNTNIIKQTYLEAIKKYPSLIQDYYWFLLSIKDKSIKNYLDKIHNKQILLGAYLMLNQKYKALQILKELLKEENDIKLWMDYYYATNSEKIKFMIFKKINTLVSKNKNILFDKTILNFYFYSALKYQSDYQLRKLLYYMKKHHLEYQRYYPIYLEHIRAYEKLKAFR